jgi:hypothetical protein
LSDTNDFDFPSEPEELKTAVGDAEMAARRFLGNERYESIVAHNDAEAQATLAINAAVADRLNAIADTYRTVNGSITILTLLGIAWSVIRWVTWARR